MNIVLENVCKSYGKTKVLENFSACINEGEITYLKGSSGIGKTTLLNLISGLEKCDSGKIYGTEDKKISYMFQEDRLFDNFSVYENLLAVNENRELLNEISDKCLCKDFLDKYPKNLSGGMSRRVSLARALLYDGDIVLLDEAFKGLDKDTKIRVCENIMPYLENKTVIIVSHEDIYEIKCDREIYVV